MKRKLGAIINRRKTTSQAILPTDETTAMAEAEKDGAEAFKTRIRREPRLPSGIPWAV